MATVNDLIADAMTQIGELAQGETQNAEDSAYCLGRLNSMLESWSIERLMVYEIVRTSYTLTSKQTFTIGPGASDFNTARPVKIETATIIYDTLEFPLRPVSEVDWALITDKGATGKIPEQIYFEPAYPIALINLHPIPIVNVSTSLNLGVWLPLTQFTNTAATLAFPPGYYDAILFNLCLLIMPGYDKPPDAIIAGRALEAKQNLAKVNAIIQGIPLPGPAPAQQ